MVRVVAAVELQKAIYEALSRQYEVFEVSKPNHPKPFIQFGEESMSDVNTKSHKRTEHNVGLISYFKGTSSIPHKEMNAFILESINRNLRVSGFSVDLVLLGLHHTTKEEKSDGVIFRTITTFDITLSRRK